MRPNTPSHRQMNTQTNRQTNKQSFRLRQLFASQRDIWILAALLAIVTALAVIGLLMLSGWFISAAAIAGMVAVGSHSFNYMVPAAIIRVLAIARTAGRYGEMLLSHHAVFGLLQQLRVRFFNRFAKLPLTQVSNTLHASHAMHRLTHDIDTLNEFPLRVVLPWLITTITTIAVAAMLYQFTANIWLIGGLMMACLLLPAVLTLLGVRQARTTQALAESRRVSLLNSLSALTHLLIWQRWTSQLARFEHIEATNTQHQRSIQRYQSSVMLGIYWLIAGLVIGLLWHFYQHPLDFSAPVLLALILGVFGITDLVASLVTHYLAFGNSLAAKDQLNALLDSAPTSNDKDDTTTLSPLADTLNKPLILKINNLDAKLPQAILGLNKLNITVRQGKPLLVTGRSGAGKSTLLQVLACELKPQGGEIFLNNLHLPSLQNTPNLIGYLGQQLDIFDQTLATNLRLGKSDATDSELWQVLEKVGLKDWAQSQPQQLQTPLGEYGHTISGGQARRIALARLLLTPKTLLLLDEPFAGLDKDSREALWQMLTLHQQDGLLIVVTHRVWQMAETVDILHLAETT